MPFGAFRLNSISKIVSAGAGGGAATRSPVIMLPLGNAQMDTTTKKFGTSSYKGDGVGDALYKSSFGTYDTKNFTFEFWFNPATVSGSQFVASLGNSTGTNYGAIVFYRNTTTMRIYSSYNGSTWGAINGLALATVSANTWYHVAATREGNTVKVYMDGALYHTVTLTGSLMNGPDLYIGSTRSGGNSFNGFIDEVRVSNNIRYTGAFTPSSTEFTNDTNTELLLHCNGLNGQTLFPDDNSDTYVMASIVPNTTVFIESESLTFNVETLNTASTVYYSLDGTISANDLASNSLTGTINLTNNKGSFTITSATNTDSPTGAETFVTNLRTESTSGTIIASTGTITLNDSGVSNSWDSYTKLNALTNVSRYTGLNNTTFTIHGLQNTDKLVFVFGSQNAARTDHLLYPAVFDLTTKELVIGTGVSFGNTSNPTPSYMGLSVSGEGNIGMGSVTNFSTPYYYVRVRGYTITNWGSCSTTNLPTLSLSTAYTRTTFSASADAYIEFLGNGRWMVSQYDGNLTDGGGYLHGVQIFSYSANGSVALVATSGSLTGRGLGRVQAVRNGMSSSNYAAHIYFTGNNANLINVYFVQGTGSTIKNLANNATLPSGSGNSFNSRIFYNPSGKAFIFTQMGNGSTNTWQVISEWTNPDSSASTPSVTFGTYYDGHTNPGRIIQVLPKGSINTTTSFYNPVFVSNTQYRFDVVNINTTSRSFSSKDTGQTANGSWVGDLYFESWYDSTYGQYIFQWNHDTSSNVSFYIHKWNP